MFQIMDAACVMRSKRLNEAAAERALRSCAGLGKLALHLRELREIQDTPGIGMQLFGKEMHMRRK